MEDRNPSRIGARMRFFFSVLTLVFLLAPNQAAAKFQARLSSSEALYDNFILETKPPSKDDMKNFTRAYTLATYLKLSFVDAIYLAVPVNFILIGFDGEGNQEFKLTEEELHRWYEEIIHIPEHTRVPKLEEEFTPFYRLKGSGAKQHHLPLISYTHYNYSGQVHFIAPKFTGVLERAIKLLSRKDDPINSEGESEVWQVDIGGMSHIFQRLVNYLELKDAYNIFILNPKRDPSHGKYGYRYGLSASEISFLRNSPDKVAALLKSKEPLQDFMVEAEKNQGTGYDWDPITKLSWTVKQHEWVDSVDKLALDPLEAFLRMKSDEEILLWNAQRILSGENLLAASALGKALSSKEESYLQPECLVDAWVGQQRWAFLDLSAGPFTWGPTVGGDGVRSETSVPSVDRSFNNIELPEKFVDDKAINSHFENLWRSRFQYFRGDSQHTLDLQMLQAEIDVYWIFALRQCTTGRVPNQFCKEFQERASDVRKELVSLYEGPNPGGESDNSAVVQKNRKGHDLVNRLDPPNIFGFRPNERVPEKYSAARDSFLAHLGSILTTWMRHIVTPSTADGAFHFYKTVSFELYFITQDPLKTQDIRLLPVDTEAVREALLGLIVSSQKAVTSMQALSLAEDPVLAMAFTSAKRVSRIPTLLANGTTTSATRAYVDSQILQHNIQHIDFSTNQNMATKRNQVTVPIFWFLRSSGKPLLIDKHYQAKALSDMVVVVQSTDSAWESHLQCNGESIRWDLVQPGKAAIAAVAEHMAGILPSYLTFSASHETSIQDWLWSVGSHPFSSTSSGYSISQFHNDAIARNYIVTALDESVEIMNSAVGLLVNERTKEETFSTFRDHEKGLKYSFNRVIWVWKQIAVFTANLKFGEALRLLPQLETNVENFYYAANETIAALHPIHCRRQHKVNTGRTVFAGFSLIFVAGVLILLVRKLKSKKAKINRR